MFTAAELEDAARIVHAHVPPTAAHHWPTLSARLGADVIVKHENHAPTGAFKVRGGVTFVDWLLRSDPACPGIDTATRGNHGQSQARAARAAGLRAVIYAPHGNSVEKNAAMRAFGAELVETGHDFDAAREAAFAAAEREGLHFVPPYHTELVRGVSTWAWELFAERADLDVLYVPIGCGSGICGAIAARDALRRSTEIVGVVSSEAPGAKLSVEAGRVVETNSAETFADGVAVRVPVAEALDLYARGAARVLSVTEDEIAEAIRILFQDTHNLAEGAGAAALAAARTEAQANRGRKVAVVLSGGNIDRDWYRTVLDGGTPAPR